MNIQFDSFTYVVLQILHMFVIVETQLQASKN